VVGVDGPVARLAAATYLGRRLAWPTEEARRRCVLFGCLEAAAWIINDPQGGELPACEVDLDVLLNDALARLPLDTSIRVQAWS
jgi:hypothetical protein